MARVGIQRFLSREDNLPAIRGPRRVETKVGEPACRFAGGADEVDAAVPVGLMERDGDCLLYTSDAADE